MGAHRADAANDVVFRQFGALARWHCLAIDEHDAVFRQFRSAVRYRYATHGFDAPELLAAPCRDRCRSRPDLHSPCVAHDLETLARAAFHPRRHLPALDGDSTFAPYFRPFIYFPTHTNATSTALVNVLTESFISPQIARVPRSHLDEMRQRSRLSPHRPKLYSPSGQNGDIKSREFKNGSTNSQAKSAPSFPNRSQRSSPYSPTFPLPPFYG